MLDSSFIQEGRRLPPPPPPPPPRTLGMLSVSELNKADDRVAFKRHVRAQHNRDFIIVKPSVFTTYVQYKIYFFNGVAKIIK